MLGDAAVNFAVEHFDDLRTALLPPHFWGGDLFAVVQYESIGQSRKGIGLGLVVVGEHGIGRVRPIAARTERGDVQLFHHLLMVGFGVGLDLELLRRGTGTSRWCWSRRGRSSLGESVLTGQDSKSKQRGDCKQARRES